MSDLARTARRSRRIRSGLRVSGNPPVIPAFFDSLESIHQQLISSHIPDNRTDTLLITADRFLGHALSHNSPHGNFMQVDHRLEALPQSLLHHDIQRLIVDPISLSLPLIMSLNILRATAHHHPHLRLLILAPEHPQGLLRFIAASGPFTVVARQLRTREIYRALTAAAPLPSFPHRWRMSPRLWQIVQAMSEGQSLRSIALVQNLPYHRVVYQLNRLASRLELIPRRRFLTLLHHLSLPGDML